MVLDFDHPGDKRYPIAHIVGANFSWKKSLGEIEKCVVRCVNCHRRKTAKDLGHKILQSGGQIKKREQSLAYKVIIFMSKGG